MNTTIRGYWLLVPAATLYIGIFLAPFVYFFAISFFSVKFFKIQPNFTLSNYYRLLTENSGTLLFTVGLAIIIAVVAVILGFIYAYIARFKAGRHADILIVIALLTLFGGYLMKIYAWKTILGNHGVLNSILMNLGITSEPITILFYTPAAVVITLVHFLLPLAILPIYSALRGMSDIEIEAARDLGASPLAVLADLIIPRAQQGIIGAFALCFLMASGDYVTPALVGGTTTMMGSVIAPQFGTFFNWPLGAAMSFTVLINAAVVIGLALLCLKQIGRR